MKKIIAIDGANAYYTAKSTNPPLPYFPIAEFLELVKGDGSDIIETLYSVQQHVADEKHSTEEIQQSLDSMCYNIELSGAKTIVCPAKRAGNDFKHSDDQLLQIKTLSICMRLKPDFLILVTGDDDYAPLVWELREHGVRTEIFTTKTALGKQLQRAAYSTRYLDDFLNSLKPQKM